MYDVSKTQEYFVDVEKNMIKQSWLSDLTFLDFINIFGDNSMEVDTKSFIPQVYTTFGKNFITNPHFGYYNVSML